MKTLITYFSAEGNTKNIVEQIENTDTLDIYEIVPEVPYTKADINYKNPLSRCNKEWMGKKDVPVIGKIKNFDEYDTILIGFPIWYGCAPNVVNTFCKGYDWTNKKVIIFATSGGSPMGKTQKKLEPYVQGAIITACELIHSVDELKALL